MLFQQCLHGLVDHSTLSLIHIFNIANITKQYGDIYALDHVNLNFEAGKIYGLLGRNGAGKSTLLKAISNRIFPDDGVITLNDQPVMENDEVLHQMYLMSEEDMYPKSMKVKEVFHWTDEFYGCFNIEKAKELAQKFELNMNKKVKDLSTGYQSIYKLIIALSLDVPYICLLYTSITYSCYLIYRYQFHMRRTL